MRLETLQPVSSVAGGTPTKLTRPVGKAGLAIKVSAGNFLVMIGDRVADAPAAYIPAASITDGTGGWPIAEGQELVVLPCPAEVTIAGFEATEDGGIAAAYFWL